MNRFVILLILLSNLFAVKFRWDDFKDKEFRSHFGYGLATTAAGFKLGDLVFNRTITEEYMDWDYENPDQPSYKWKTRTYIKENPNDFMYKSLIALGVSASIAYLTKQESEPDARAWTVGCFTYIGGEMIWHFIKVKIWK